MIEFIEWINSTDSYHLDRVIVAGISHYEFVRIHPFIDGNGRTARALATLILNLREFDIKKFFALDDYYDSDRKAYYRALDSVNAKTLDLTKWLEYFTDGVLVSITKVKEKVILNNSPRRTQRAQRLRNYFFAYFAPFAVFKFQ